MSTPLISIIVPIYKVESYLRRCLDSIVNQTYSNLEIILVDDGSPDSCPQICDEYAAKDSRIIVIHKKNGGLSDARNAGLDICKGEYVYFIDSDDFITLNAISVLYNACEKYNADIAVGDYIPFEQEPEAFPRNKDTTFQNISFENAMKMQFYFNHEFTQSVVAWNKLIRANIAKRFPFPKGLLYEDNFTTFKYFYRAKTVITEEILYYYQNRDDSIVNRMKNTREECVITIKYLEAKISFLRERGFLDLEHLFLERLAERYLTLYILTKDKASKVEIAQRLKIFHLTQRPGLNFAIHHPKLWQFFKLYFLNFVSSCVPTKAEVYRQKLILKNRCKHE